MALQIYQSLFNASGRCLNNLYPVNQSKLLATSTVMPACVPCVNPVGFPCCTNCFSVSPPNSGSAFAATNCQTWNFGTGGTSLPLTLVPFSEAFAADPGETNAWGAAIQQPGYFCTWVAYPLPLLGGGFWSSCSVAFQFNLTTASLTFKFLGNSMRPPIYLATFSSIEETGICNINETMTLTLSNPLFANGSGGCGTWPSTMDVTAIACPGE